MFSDHYFISILLTVILFVILFFNDDHHKIDRLLLFLISFALLSFNSYLILTNSFSLKTHLPLHLCYITQLGIFLSIIFKSNTFYPWLLLNSLGGGITGLLNSDLDSGALFIEFLYFYMSHFNILLFAIYLWKQNYVIKKTDFFKSIFFNSIFFIFVIFLNFFLDSNYWFTKDKPNGINLTNILPEWPYYLIILIFIGIISYCITFKLFNQRLRK